MEFSRSDLDFDLPEGLIAQEPLKERDLSRLMVLRKKEETISHHTFKDLPSLLKVGDVIVINRAKVSPAKLIGKKITGGRVEIILIDSSSSPGYWRALVRPELKLGTEFHVDGTTVRLVERSPNGENLLEFGGRAVEELIKEQGILPLPPYIRRDLNDPRKKVDDEYYQTVYAAEPGSLAAPTAGLHFSEALLKDLKKKGINIISLHLRVGWGTFKPISKSLNDHEMLPEHFDVSLDTYQKLVQAKNNGRRIIAVGTTTTRVVESLGDREEERNLSRETNLFIRPGFKFHWISGLITNFHVPRSTPIALTAAFSGLSFLERAYAEAIEKSYRFFSYGDAMLIL